MVITNTHIHVESVGFCGDLLGFVVECWVFIYDCFIINKKVLCSKYEKGKINLCEKCGYLCIIMDIYGVLWSKYEKGKNNLCQKGIIKYNIVQKSIKRLKKV